jgi:hypothetical protein
MALFKKVEEKDIGSTPISGSGDGNGSRSNVTHLLLLDPIPDLNKNTEGASEMNSTLALDGAAARIWAAKMVVAESWRFPPLSLQCALEFTRAFSGAIVQQANSR